MAKDKSGEAQASQQPASDHPDSDTAIEQTAPSVTTEKSNTDKYRNISLSTHTLAPDGRAFAPGAVDSLEPEDVERLSAVEHIFKLKPPKPVNQGGTEK